LVNNLFIIIVMGQKQSTHSELENNLAKLTDAERQKLQGLFEVGKEEDGPESDGTYYKMLEVIACTDHFKQLKQWFLTFYLVDTPLKVSYQPVLAHPSRKHK